MCGERSDEVQNRDRLCRCKGDEPRDEGNFRKGDECYAENANDGCSGHGGEARDRSDGAQAMEMPRRDRHDTELRGDRDRERQREPARECSLE